MIYIIFFRYLFSCNMDIQMYNIRIFSLFFLLLFLSPTALSNTCGHSSATDAECTGCHVPQNIEPCFETIIVVRTPPPVTPSPNIPYPGGGVGTGTGTGKGSPGEESGENGTEVDEQEQCEINAVLEKGNCVRNANALGRTGIALCLGFAPNIVAIAICEIVNRVALDNALSQCDVDVETAKARCD